MPQRRANITSLTTRTAIALAVVLCWATSILLAETPPAAREAMLEQMRALAKETRIGVVDSQDSVELVNSPVFRYDDQPRRFIDATLWAWTVQGRPVAFQKIEAVEYGDAKAPSSTWQYCFASMSAGLLNVGWPGGRRFVSQEAGIRSLLLPGAPEPAAGNVQRRRQAREMVRKFAGRIVNDPKTNTREQMRLLTTPLMEFADPRTKEYQGAVFGFSTNGTNPDVLLLLEIRSDGEKGAATWHYAPVRMTCCEATLAYEEQEVWKTEWVNGTEAPFPTWTFFNTPRDPLVHQEEP
jgi:hypothetical protein